MILTKRVEVSWNGNNRVWYESRGYIFTKNGDKFTVPVEDLTRGSKLKIEIECGYCEISFLKSYKDYVIMKEKSLVKKDCCPACVPQKNKEVSLIKYGTEHPNQNKEMFKRVIEGNQEKYGVDFYIASPEGIKKKNTTVQERYGVENVFQSEEVKAKKAQTNLERYGSEYYQSSDDYRKKYDKTIKERYGERHYNTLPEIKNKRQETNLKRYGTLHPQQNKEIKEKTMKTLYKNGTAPSSFQQNTIHCLIGGELNYPVGRAFLDIAFPDEMIYVEYDGGGHDLSVKLGMQSQEGFDRKERNRSFFLFDKGWKEIRLVSDEDRLPNDEEIIETVNKAKSLLNNERVKSIIIDWDSSTVLFGFKRKCSLEDFLSNSFVFSSEEVM